MNTSDMRHKMKRNSVMHRMIKECDKKIQTNFKKIDNLRKKIRRLDWNESQRCELEINQLKINIDRLENKKQEIIGGF